MTTNEFKGMKRKSPKGIKNDLEIKQQTEVWTAAVSSCQVTTCAYETTSLYNPTLLQATLTYPRREQ